MFTPQGIIPPVATPLTASEDLDVPRFRGYLDELIAGGVHGLFVLGTNSEFYAFDEAEKQTLLATAVAHVRGRVPVIAGTGAETTREVVQLTKMAEKERVDAVAIITPYYVQPNQREIEEHYRRVAEATALPVLLYNNPAPCGGVRLEPATVARLAEVSNIVGIKDSSGDLQNTNDYIRQAPDHFAVLQGRDSIIVPSMLCGARGAVPASANLVPRLCVQLFDAASRKTWPDALELQERLTPIRKAISLGTPPAGVKAALEMMGRSIGPCRRPIGSLAPEHREQLRETLRHAGLIPENHEA